MCNSDCKNSRSRPEKGIPTPDTDVSSDGRNGDSLDCIHDFDDGGNADYDGAVSHGSRGSEFRLDVCIFKCSIGNADFNHCDFAGNL